MYLDGYPNDGCVIVNVEDGINYPKVVDYNTTATAENYFRKLNEEYNKGIIDPDFAVQTYDEYISKLLTGCVLGMNDQYWDFAYTIKTTASMLSQKYLSKKYLNMLYDLKVNTNLTLHFYIILYNY